MKVYNSIQEALDRRNFLSVQHIFSLQSTYVFRSFPVPYETIMIGGTQQHTFYGRIYTTSLFQVNNEVVTYDEMRSLRGSEFKGTVFEDQLVLVEVFEDEGKDGHIDYVLKGLVLMSQDNEDVKRLLNGTFFTHPF